MYDYAANVGGTESCRHSPWNNAGYIKRIDVKTCNDCKTQTRKKTLRLPLPILWLSKDRKEKKQTVEQKFEIPRFCEAVEAVTKGWKRRRRERERERKGEGERGAFTIFIINLFQRAARLVDRKERYGSGGKRKN